MATRDVFSVMMKVFQNSEPCEGFRKDVGKFTCLLPHKISNIKLNDGKGKEVIEIIEVKMKEPNLDHKQKIFLNAVLEEVEKIKERDKKLLK